MSGSSVTGETSSRRGQGPPQARRPWRWSLLLSLVVSLLLAGLYLNNSEQVIFQELEERSLTWRLDLRGPRPAPDAVAILAIDEPTLKAYGGWPLPRAVLAEAMVAAEAAGATAIGLDVLLIDPEQPSDGITLSPGDNKLLQVLRSSPQVILGMALLFEEAAAPAMAYDDDLQKAAYGLVVTPPSGALQPPLAHDVLLPLPAFRHQGQMGHVNVMLFDGGNAVSLHPVAGLDSVLLPSFPAAVAARHSALGAKELGVSLDGFLLLGQRRIPLDIDLSLPLNPYGPEGTIATYSLLDLLQNSLPAGALEGRAVLIGANAYGVGERFDTPFDVTLPGVELLAAGTANLIDDSALLRTAETRWADSLAILLLGLVAWSLGCFLGIRMATLAAALLLLAWWGAAFLALSELQIWLALAVPSVSILLNAGIGVIGRAALERVKRSEAERQRGNLARYVSPLMADRLAAAENPEFDRRHQEASILFVDLGGFTTDSETRSPLETADFLIDYHRRLEGVVLQHGGVIEQFQGDGAMVIFGLPEPRADDASRALACARALIEDLHGWRPDTSLRAGINDGPVVIARLGGRTQAQLAAAGDTVNVASRLEQLAKDEGLALVISEGLAAKVEAGGDGALLAGLSSRPDQAIRGRRHAMALRVASLGDLGLDRSADGAA
ncbi:MAG: adenylate/guanylate cyclase domain-containing protein [Rhodospirillales bacterium]